MSCTPPFFLTLLISLLAGISPLLAKLGVSESQGSTTTLTTFDYDANGNRSTKTQGSTGGSPVIDSYQYDSFNRLTELTLNGTPTRHYAYDPFTRRIAIRNPQSPIPNSSHFFAFSGSSPTEEWDGTRNNGSLLDHVGGGTGGRLYTEDSSGDPSFPLYNQRGDLTAQISNGGTITWSGQYSADGLLQQQTGTRSGGYGANGKWEEPGSLINDGHRYRDRSTGSFLTPDPAGFIDGPNRYNYVHHNPWSAWDPDGLTTVIPMTTGDIGNVSPNYPESGQSIFSIGDGSNWSPPPVSDVLGKSLGEGFEVYRNGLEYERRVHHTDTFPLMVQYLDGLVAAANLGTKVGAIHANPPMDQNLPSWVILDMTSGMSSQQLDDLAESGKLTENNEKQVRDLSQQVSDARHDDELFSKTLEGASMMIPDGPVIEMAGVTLRGMKGIVKAAEFARDVRVEVKVAAGVEDLVKRGGGIGDSERYIYRTISPDDPHFPHFNNIGDSGIIRPRGGHNDLTLHVQFNDTDSIFTSWSKNATENWKQWGYPGHIQLMVDTNTLNNPALEVFRWSKYPWEEEITVIGEINKAVRVK